MPMYLVDLGAVLAPDMRRLKSETGSACVMPDRRSEHIDAIIGRNVVPTYQWFMAGGRNELSGEELLMLERIFFAGQDHGEGDIELSRHPDGYHVLRIRHARARRLEIELGTERWPLNAAMHLDGGRVRIVSFAKGANFVA